MKNKALKNIIYTLFAVIFITAEGVYAAQSHFMDIKTVLSKFGLAMFGVMLFSFLLYFGLSLYNKFFVSEKIKDFKMRQDSLKTPSDIDEAIMTYITKNRLK